MPYIRLIGGLGNQLFQVAAGRFIQREHRLSVAYDCSWFGDQAARDAVRELEVRRVLSGQRILEFPKPIRKVAYSRRNPLLRVEGGTTDDILAGPLGRHSVLHGYFQYAKYPLAIGTELLELFEPELRPAHPRRGEEDVALHIRLGDYYHNKITRDHHGVLSPAYFAQAVSRLRSEGFGGQVVAFTDSPEVFEDEYRPSLGIEVTVADTAGAWETLSAMAAFRAIVISNSSLSWWAAFVASQTTRHATVIRPHPWFNGPSAADENLQVHGWQSLNRIG